MTKQLSKYETYQPWINECHRLTAGQGLSHPRAARLADAIVEEKIAKMRQALAHKKA